MEFSIKNKDGQVLFTTSHESCVPTDKFDSMNSAGLVFYVDGKKQSVSSIKSIFKDARPITIPKYESAPDLDDIHQMTTTATTPAVPKVISTVKLPEPAEPTKTSDASLSVDLSKVDFPITSRSIVCLQNNKVYRNQKEAGEDLGIDPSWISYCITNNKSHKGYTFKKAVDLQ